MEESGVLTSGKGGVVPGSGGAAPLRRAFAACSSCKPREAMSSTNEGKDGFAIVERKGGAGRERGERKTRKWIRMETSPVYEFEIKSLFSLSTKPTLFTFTPPRRWRQTAVATN